MHCDGALAKSLNAVRVDLADGHYFRFSHTGGVSKLEKTYLPLLMNQAGLSGLEREAFEASARLRNRAIKQARIGNFGFANIMIGRARYLVDAAAVSPVCHLLSDSFHAAALAFVFYAKRDFQEALDCLQIATQTDYRIEALCEVPLLPLHRMQLVHNECRVERSRGNLSTALTKACRELMVLQATLYGQCYDGDLHGKNAGKIPDQFLSDMALQFLVEICRLTHGRGPAVLEIFNTFVDSYFEKLAVYRTTSIVERWLTLKRGFSLEAAEFVRLSTSFFVTEGLQYCDLRCSAALDLLTRLQQADAHLATQLALDLSFASMPSYWNDALRRTVERGSDLDSFRVGI
jgi:hypothetical protein